MAKAFYGSRFSANIELHPKNWTQFLEVQFFYDKVF